MRNVFHNIKSLSEAAQFLCDEKIDFKKCVRQEFSNGTFGILIYFMLNGKDVAFFWDDMKTLVIHDTPRSWDSFAATSRTQDVPIPEVSFGSS